MQKFAYSCYSMKYLVKDHTDLRKDSYSKVVTNENNESYKKYVLEKQQREKQLEMEKDINIMRKDIAEIKTILLRLLDNR